ncbi:MAG: DNA repair protein RadA, partial [Cytophagales bacterium]|nr:DNA repair protein RadA [Cytophagales bacterium]
FLNIAGGFRVEDPALDLAVCLSILSSFEEIALASTTCFCAEIGLGGELRAVNRLENRIAEASKLGFERICISKYGLKGVDVDKFSIQVMGFSRLDEVVSTLLST